MNKCSYCDFRYDEVHEYYKHLNAKHFKCMCGTVFDQDEFGDDYILCKECREKGDEVWK